jgi:tRNA G37 N-methylase Trm5
LGIDVDENRLILARESIARNNLQVSIQVWNKDVIEFIEDADEIGNADVIVMYLFREANLEMATHCNNSKRKGGIEHKR